MIENQQPYIYVQNSIQQATDIADLLSILSHFKATRRKHEIQKDQWLILL